MSRYLLRRTISAVVSLICVTAVIFLLLCLVDNSAEGLMRESGTGQFPSGTPDDCGFLRLDRYAVGQYVLWLRNVLRGDLGKSCRFGTPVGEMIAQRLGPTALLGGTGLLLALLIALPVGTMAAYRPGSLWDRLSTFLALVGACFPRFIVCIAGIYIFAYQLRVVPLFGMPTVGIGTLSGTLRHLLLPAGIIAFSSTGGFIKHTRSACLETFQKDYLTTARAKGLPEFFVVVNHGLRTALGPIVTHFSLEIPGIVGGSAITEKIFSWPGIGTLMIDAIRSRDQTLIMGVTLVIAIFTLFSSILLDLAYGILDPRISRQ